VRKPAVFGSFGRDFLVDVNVFCPTGIFLDKRAGGAILLQAVLDVHTESPPLAELHERSDIILRRRQEF
jgi:hypothetical protein